jgi:hypothetical protein
MRKIVISLVLLSFCFGLSGALAQERIRFEPDYPKSSTFGLLAGFFFVQDETFQEMYGKSVFFFGGEYTLRFPVKERHGVDVAVDLRQLKKSGRTSYTEEEAHVRLTSLSLSLRYSLEYDRFTFFVGPGFDYVMYKENYAETFPIKSVDGSAAGYHITGGGYYNVLPSLAVKAYFKYCAADTEPDGFRVNLGGTEWGLGLVYRFEF